MRNHLVSDVPVLLFLSGGTDSACLAAAARKAGAQNLSAMTVGFGEAGFDETELSRRTARALDIPHQVVTLDASRVTAGLSPTDPIPPLLTMPTPSRTACCSTSPTPWAWRMPRRSRIA